MYPLTDEYFEFIEAFKSIKELNDHVAGRKLKDGFEEVIDRFSINFLNLNANHNVSITPKIHIIINHVKEYCRRTKCSLGSCSDQTIEAVHQVVNNRFSSSNYYIKCTDNDNYAEKLLNGILHVNSYNI